MNSVAILDLGTNTFQLLIANIIKNKPMLVYNESIAVKLAEGEIQKGYIRRRLLIADFQHWKNSKNQQICIRLNW